jgi:hypothetical protein
MTKPRMRGARTPEPLVYPTLGEDLLRRRANAGLAMAFERDHLHIANRCQSECSAEALHFVTRRTRPFG